MLSTGEWTVKKLLLVLVLCGLSGAQSIRHTVHVTRKGFQPAEINARPNDIIIFDMHDSMVNENWSIVEANLTSRWSRCLQLKEFDDDALWKCHQSNCTTAKAVRSNIVYGLRENSQSRCSHEDSLLFIKVYQGSYDRFGENDDDCATPPSEKTPCTKLYDIFNNNEHYYRSYRANNQYDRFHDADGNACGHSTGYNTGISQHAIQFVVGALPKDHQWRMINEYVALILGVGVLLMYCFFLWKVDQVQRQLDMTEEVIHQLVVAEYGFPASSKVLADTKLVVLDAYRTV